MDKNPVFLQIETRFLCFLISFYDIIIFGDFMKKFQTENADQTIELGYKIGKQLHRGDVVLLTGDLSAGKTTLTKGIGKALEVQEVINSPTFTIVKTYRGKDCPLYHLDLYRLNGVGYDFDLEEYMETDGICVIEWAFQVEEILPKRNRDYGKW